MQGYAGVSVNTYVKPSEIHHTWTNLTACGE